MSATGIAYTVLEIFLATVLATGGVSKIIAPTDWRNGLRSYRVSLLNHHIVCVGVPIAELSIAALLSYDLNPTIPLVAASLFCWLRRRPAFGDAAKCAG